MLFFLTLLPIALSAFACLLSDDYVTPYFTIPAILVHGFKASGNFITARFANFVHRTSIAQAVDAVCLKWSDHFGQDVHAGWFNWRCYTHGSDINSWPFRSTICFSITSESLNALNIIRAFGILLICYLCVAYVVYRIRRGFLQASLFSLYIDCLSYFCKQPNYDCTSLRTAFANSIPILNRPATNHSHPVSAATRNAATRQMELICMEVGRNMYMHQMSASDVRRGLTGSRAYFWGKDLATQRSWVNPNNDDIVCMNDVDMYMDMPMVLANHPRAYILSTFQPSTAAAVAGEFSFTFNRHNEVTYNVSGGASYKHQIWNYGSDVLVASTPLFLGLFHRVTAYTVDRRQTDDHHQLICLSPIRTVISPLFSLSLGGEALGRLAVACGIFGRLTTITGGGVTRSTSFLDGLACATIPAHIDDNIASVARNGSTKITPGTVRTLSSVITQEESIVLSDYHRHQAGDIADVVYSLPMGIGRYQYSLPTYDPAAKNKLLSFMSPILPDHCFSPDVTKENEIRAVKARVLDVATKPMSITPFVHDCLKEFAQFLIPDNIAGTLYPTDMDEVYERQHRPQQRRLIDEALRTGAAVSSDRIDSFVKPEAYQKPSEPRIISTIPGINKCGYSAFIYTFSKLLRAQPWYAFAKTPIEIATRVAQLCMNALSWLLLSDFSKMDGRVSNVLRLVEHVLMFRAFHPSCHARVAELMNTQKQNKARTSCGVVYETGDSRLSGSPETADFNSVENAFTAYVGNRMTVMEDGTFMSPAMAWAKLGIYGGDDGGTPDLTVEMHTKASLLVGQVVEGVQIPKGKLGVSFLAREYSDAVWYGSLDSMCDIKRQLSKFHTTTHLPGNMSALQKLAVKCNSYFLTDKNTPVLGDLASLVESAYPQMRDGVVITPELRSKVGTWFAFHPQDVQYPNVRGDWMFDILKRDLPEFDLGKFNEWLSRCQQDPQELLKAPLCYPIGTGPKPKVSMMINGEVIDPEEEKHTTPVFHAELGNSTKIQPCFPFKAGKCARGDSCKYSHSTDPLPPCRAFSTPEGCKFGAKCGYPHVGSGGK